MMKIDYFTTNWEQPIIGDKLPEGTKFPLVYKFSFTEVPNFRHEFVYFNITIEDIRKDNETDEILFNSVFTRIYKIWNYNERPIFIQLRKTCEMATIDYSYKHDKMVSNTVLKGTKVDTSKIYEWENFIQQAIDEYGDRNYFK